MQEIIIIAAMAENHVIGKNNVIPWSLKEDMVHFRKLTNGFPCIMGRKTWESLPKKPLPGRLNIVVSKTLNAETQTKSMLVFPSLPAAIEHCGNYEKVFIIGGQAIYKQAMELADKIELTIIHKQYEGDTFFPEIDSARWTVVNTEEFNTFSFITYVKKN